MYCATAVLPRSLDERYLEFLDQTNTVFAQYPQIEPLRYFIFRDLVVEQRARSWKDITKDWSRPIRRLARRTRTLEKADVVLLVEGLREVIVDALLPVYHEILSRDIRVQLIGVGGASNLPESAYYLQSAPHVFPPAWARNSWDALCDTIKELRCRSFERSFRSFCANMQGYYDALDTMLDAIDPKIVLNASTQLGGGAGLIVACRQRGILTLLLQHGILQPLYLPIIADYMLTWGQSSTETLACLGVSPQKLIALGSPRHDAIGPTSDANTKGTFYRALSLQEKPTMVFFSNGNDFVRNGDAPYECARWLEKSAALHKNDINVVVRLHPNEDGSLYQNCPHLHITKDVPDLAVTLEGCDWVGSLCSTVLYDALLFKKPVWQFHADHWPELANNWRQGLAVRISSQTELSESMSQILSVERHGFDERLSSRVFANHGRAAGAVADFIKGRLEGAKYDS